jgi:hypothetical protein
MRLDSRRRSPAAGALVLLLSGQTVAPALAPESDRLFAALGLKPGLRVAELVREMTGDGFYVVARHPDWNGDDDRYCVVFRRARWSRAPHVVVPRS